MIGRAIWFTLLTLLALLATVAQVDRRSRYDGELASLVPSAYVGFASEQRTRQALAQGYGERALAEAQRLLRYRPLPANHLTMLALAEGMQSNAASATAALEVAAARSWRDPLPQAASAQAALTQGEHTIAAQRVSALLATGELPDRAGELFARLVASPEGREAMAARYAAPGHWQANSLTGAALVARPPDIARALELALEMGAELPCDRLLRLAEDFVRRGYAKDASRFQPVNCTRR
ncbi:MAG: hypothetical protein JY451_07610 [Erythrobacter sp.]|nr:MAG: hypothetical protein JY451_07610 [Erythrobacter sp.]